jgi:hypothetical protein
VRTSRLYAEWTYLLTSEETERVLKQSAEADLTVTENLCRAMATALLEAQPEKSRVCISVPTDLGTQAALSPDMAGNYTGALIVQLFRDQPLDSQIRRAFRWGRCGVHYWTPWLMGQVMGGHAQRRSGDYGAKVPGVGSSPYQNANNISLRDHFERPHVHRSLCFTPLVRLFGSSWGDRSRRGVDYRLVKSIPSDSSPSQGGVVLAD